MKASPLPILRAAFWEGRSSSRSSRAPTRCASKSSRAMPRRSSDMRLAVCVVLISWCASAQTAPRPAAFTAPDDIAWRKVNISSEGTRMYGEVFTPQSVAADRRLPIILMAHGWGGTVPAMRRDAILFARAGYYVLVFDYRGWGGSDSRLIPTGEVPKANASGTMTVDVREVREVGDPIDMA